MGRTIPSYRIASEMERWKWRPFRKLLDKQDRKIFDEMLSISHLYNAAGTMACRPVLIHVILMSIIFELVQEGNWYTIDGEGHCLVD
jgi:hypothetical protein